MTSQTALIGLAVCLAACSPTREPVDDDRPHVQLLWRNPALKWVTSSLLLKDSLLYFGSFNNAFCAAHLADGHLKLAYPTGGEPYYPPVLAGKRIYFSSFDLHVYCLDTAGKLVWKRKTADRVKNALLLARDSLLYIPVRGDGVWAVQARTGQAVWHLPQPAVSLATNQPLLRANRLYVGMWGSDSLLAVDRRTGTIEWATRYPERDSSAPVAAPEGLVVCTDRYYQGGQVTVLDYATGKEMWRTAVKCESLFPPLVHGRRVIVATYDDQVVCLSTGTGRILWATKLQPKEEVATRFCRFRQGLYFGTTARNLYCLDSQTGKVRFKESFNYGLANPLVANNKLYIPTGGSELWRLKD